MSTKAGAQIWTPKKVLQAIRSLYRRGESLAPGHNAKPNRSLYNASCHHWGSYKNAVEHAGLRYRDVVKGKVPKWTREVIVAELRRLHHQGADLSHNACKVAHPSLLAGAVRQFGQYRKAIEAAGIPYAEVALVVQKNWTRQRVIDAIRRRFRRGQKLSHNYVKKHDHILFSAIGRYFPTYRAAIRAAGLAYAQVAEVPQESWDQERVLSKIRALVRRRKRLTSRTLGPKLHAAITRYYGNIPAAAAAAGLPLRQVVNLPTPPVSKHQALAELRALARSGERVIKQNMSPALYKSILENFGGMKKAVKAAGLNYEQVARLPWQIWSHQRILKEMRELMAVGRRITVRNLSTKQYSAVLRYFRGVRKIRELLVLG